MKKQERILKNFHIEIHILTTSRQATYLFMTKLNIFLVPFVMSAVILFVRWVTFEVHKVKEQDRG